MLVVAHQGERIVRAVDNRPGGGHPINVYVNNMVGDLTTKSALDAALDKTVDQIAIGIRKATGY